MPYLYLGGEDNVLDDQLQALGIRRVLNVAREVDSGSRQQKHLQAESVEFRHMQWDHNEPDLEKHFDQCFAFIDGARTRHQGVLVHCQLGVSRSASLVIAYVMRTMGMGFDSAYEYVRLRAPCICPNLSLIAQLSAYGRCLQEREVPELCVSASSSENASPMELSQDDQPLAIASSLAITTTSSSAADNKAKSSVDPDNAAASSLGFIFSL
ncbi:hypothetical protein LPJ64_004233 [Coemansia asiatica]|uniref:protein-tyrosine-phosphatase n=1 Tax=Coemansia asiatica TaxID=1052880 RepID=A0A9W7XJG4_9FUNG|nr:hypothetical protein LPJ64_004233 [Coemansia asiatica]